MANVLEDIAGISFTTDLLSAVFAKSTIVINPVSWEIYHESIHRAKNHAISINDALALTVMEDQNINEIYTFDSHFRLGRRQGHFRMIKAGWGRK